MLLTPSICDLSFDGDRFMAWSFIEQSDMGIFHPCHDDGANIMAHLSIDIQIIKK